jgi:hypothetical protein
LCLVDLIVPPNYSRVSLFAIDLEVMIAWAVAAFEVPTSGVVASVVFVVVVIGGEGEEAPAVTIWSHPVRFMNAELSPENEDAPTTTP